MNNKQATIWTIQECDFWNWSVGELYQRLKHMLIDKNEIPELQLLLSYFLKRIEFHDKSRSTKEEKRKNKKV